MFLSPNVLYLSFLGFFIQLGATIIHGSGNVIVKDIMSTESLILLRTITESLPHLIKVISGYFSDLAKKRKMFLVFGYGCTFFLKILFIITTLDWYFDRLFLAKLFCVTQVLDRCVNAIRDAPRDALIIDSTEPQNLSFSFSFRRGISSLGSVIGAFVAFLLLHKYVIGKTKLYIISIIPILIGNLILIFKIKDTNSSQIELNILNKSNFFYLAQLGIMFTFFIKFLSNSRLDFVVSTIIFLLFNWSKKIDIEIISKSCILSLLSTLLFSYVLPQISKIFLFPIYVFLFFFFKHIIKGKIIEILFAKQTSKSFLKVILLSVYLNFSKLNDTLLLDITVKRGFMLIYTIPFFGLSYLFVSMSAFINHKLIKKIGIQNSILVNSLFLFLSNLLSFIGKSREIALVSLFMLSIYNGLIENTMSLLVSKSIDDDRFKATYFGAYFTINGFVSMFSGILCYKLGFAIFSKITTMLSFLSILFILITGF